MRWISLLVAIAGFALAFTTKSPGMLGLGLVAGFGGLLSFALAMAAARIAETAQPDTALIVDAEINAIRARARQAQAASSDASHLPPQTESSGFNQAK